MLVCLKLGPYPILNQLKVGSNFEPTSEPANALPDTFEPTCVTWLPFERRKFRNRLRTHIIYEGQMRDSLGLDQFKTSLQSMGKNFGTLGGKHANVNV